jgi:chemotaxis regulatin CheY-phosphate phosphatase CheZ
MKNLLTLSDEEYLLIEEAIGGNARGRAFLRMRDQRARVVGTDDVKRMIRGLASQLKKATAPETDANTHIRILRQELQEMSVYIRQTRSEVAALRPDDSGNNRIMAATGELDAIVTATERATSDILNSAENIQALVARLPHTAETKPICDELDAQVTEILTACSFQDITGQRTTKVVNTLHYLEKRVNSMIEIWGVDGMSAPPGEDKSDARPDSHLLNGPSSDGVSQDDVDALLAELNVATPREPLTAAAATPAATLAAKATKSAPKITAQLASGTVNGAANGVGNGAHNGGVAINQNEVDALFD